MTQKQNGSWRLRPLHAEELDTLYQSRIEKDFPSAERPSLAAMHGHLRRGAQEILIMTDDEGDAAYAVIAEAAGIALVTLLAVYPDRRGGGVGSTLLELLAGQYGDRRAIVLEVEDPADAADDADRETRRRRIAFYERNGYGFLEGIEHVSFGVRLLLMVHPLTDTMEGVRGNAIDDIRAIYHTILPPALWPRVTTEERGE